MGIRPGVSVNLNVNPRAKLNVRARAFVGYDIPVFENEALESGIINYMAREYDRSSVTRDEEQAIKANLGGFTATVGVTVGLFCGVCF